MPLRRRRAPAPQPVGPPPEDLVREFLRAQNLEQVQRIDEAIVHHERAVDGRFDSAGPYDRLIAIYRERERFADVVRVCEAALECVRTHDDKRTWYEQIRDESRGALKERPDARGAEF